MSYMNDPSADVWATWDWAQTNGGGWAHWGYFNHQYKGRTWTWINDQPNGNCGKIDSGK